MDVWTLVALLLVGLFAGAFSGLVGLGGGVIVVPVLALLFGMTQQSAQGTTLAMMIPPIGILAAWQYYKQGAVDLKVAGLLAIGFIIGGWFGGKLAVSIPNAMLKKIFAISIVLIALKMLFSK